MCLVFALLGLVLDLEYFTVRLILRHHSCFGIEPGEDTGALYRS